MSDRDRRSGGIGFTGLLQIALIVLKLCGVIGWSWFVVLLPIWIAVMMVLAVLIGCVLVEIHDRRNQEK